MIINKLNIKRIAVNKGETDAPLPVDPNTPLTGPIATQFFQSIARRHAQIFDRMGRVKERSFLRRALL